MNESTYIIIMDLKKALQRTINILKICLFLYMIVFGYVFYYDFRMIENKYFETVVLALILVSSGVMTLEDITYETKPVLMDTLFYLDKILTVVFLIETVIKLFSMGFVAYFSNAWCWLDFVIVGVSLVNFSAGLLGFANISIFKVKIIQFFCSIVIILQK